MGSATATDGFENVHVCCVRHPVNCIQLCSVFWAQPFLQQRVCCHLKVITKRRLPWAQGTSLLSVQNGKQSPPQKGAPTRRPGAPSSCCFPPCSVRTSRGWVWAGVREQCASKGSGAAIPPRFLKIHYPGIASYKKIVFKENLEKNIF